MEPKVNQKTLASEVAATTEEDDDDEDFPTDGGGADDENRGKAAGEGWRPTSHGIYNPA